jgi:hypothetical protein
MIFQQESAHSEIISWIQFDIAQRDKVIRGCHYAGGPTSLAAVMLPFLGVLQQTAATLEAPPPSEVSGPTEPQTPDGCAQRSGASTVLILNEIIFGASPAWVDRDEFLTRTEVGAERKVETEPAEGSSDDKMDTDSIPREAHTSGIGAIDNGLTRLQASQERGSGIVESGSTSAVGSVRDATVAGNKVLAEVITRVVHEYLAPELWECPVKASAGTEGAEATLGTARDNARLQQVGRIPIFCSFLTRLQTLGTGYMFDHERDHRYSFASRWRRLESAHVPLRISLLGLRIMNGRRCLERRWLNYSCSQRRSPD